MSDDCESLLLRMRTHVATLSKALFRMEKQSFQVAHSISFMVSVIISAVLYGDYIYTGIFFLGGNGQHIFPAFVAFGSRSAKFLSSVVQQLQIFFHKPVDFPGFG